MTSHGFTCQNEPKNMETGEEMGEIHLISIIFMKLAVSHSVLHQKTCSWTRFKGPGVNRLIAVKSSQRT